MKTIQTTSYEHNVDGSLVSETVVTETIPSGDFLRVDGLSEDQIDTLVIFRDAMLAKATR
jgi:hypothetical protein